MDNIWIKKKSSDWDLEILLHGLHSAHCTKLSIASLLCLGSPSLLGFFFPCNASLLSSVPFKVRVHVPAGYKIPVLENLGATLDQFDTIDFSDNEIRKLDGFPLLRRLKTVLMNNNRIW